ncbi:hypothetical protein FBY35_5610 [Streptomyces sp. SLBN-118]|uniref:hypothetical protein n=1 Tax=Streptomyces sp. SLBN-118 TaxID=2768454 RepID=UPI0011523568|nr:hypothetical protein [Streptomyces sp. SLBN-118]TQK44126.1 hypothetical protein FBY35_5610 [Streptomyces sp. SLBN-118]
MPDSTPPPWVDDFFPFATPAALARLVDIAWQHATREGYYEWCELLSHYGFMFDLECVPSPPEGWECSPEFGEGTRRLGVPFLAPPEFVPFGALGDGGYVGWFVPAPELGREDHPVGLVTGHERGAVQVGRDTRSGLEWMLSWTLYRWQTDASRWAATEARSHKLLDRLARELGLHPHPDRGLIPQGSPVFDVPAGWRHVPGDDGVGVLAATDAFSGHAPVVGCVLEDDQPLELALADASRMLDAGYPATALLGLKNAFANGPGCRFADLKPLWKQVYRDLGRPQLADRLDEMTESMYQDLPCFCDAPHV